MGLTSQHWKFQAPVGGLVFSGRGGRGGRFKAPVTGPPFELDPDDDSAEPFEQYTVGSVGDGARLKWGQRWDGPWRVRNTNEDPAEPYEDYAEGDVGETALSGGQNWTGPWRVPSRSGEEHFDDYEDGLVEEDAEFVQTLNGGSGWSGAWDEALSEFEAQDVNAETLNGDRRMLLGKNAWIRLIDLGDRWSRIRLGVMFALKGNGAQLNQPNLLFGIFGVGMHFSTSAINVGGSDPPRYQAAPRIRQDNGENPITDSDDTFSAMYMSDDPAIRFGLFLDIERGATDYTFRLAGVNHATNPVTNLTRSEFNTMMDTIDMTTFGSIKANYGSLGTVLFNPQDHLPGRVDFDTDLSVVAAVSGFAYRVLEGFE